MELVFSDEKKRILSDGIRTYTFANMKDYVGRLNRVKGQLPKDYWVLVSYEEKRMLNKPGYHIEALVAPDGTYMKIALEQESFRRIIRISESFVESDTLYDKRNNSFSGEEYNAYYQERTVKEIPTLEDYLTYPIIYKKKKTHQNQGDRTITAPHLSNERIIHFITANETLKPTFEEKTPKTRTHGRKPTQASIRA